MKTKFYLLLIILFAGVALPGGLSAQADNDYLVIGAVGDVMLAHWGEDILREKGESYPFSGTADLLKKADVFIGNLEAPITSGGVRDTSKKYTFRLNPALAGTFKSAGFTVSNLANNHMVDYGLQGVSGTIRTLDSLGILHCGAGLTWDEARKPAVKKVKGLKIAFLGYSATFPKEFWANKEHGGTNFPYAEVIEKDIPDAKRKYDLVIVSIHWGQELRESPKDYQVDLAHKLIDLGADMVLGHHPHVIQGIEIYRGKPILYSLGNFAFASYSENVKNSMIVMVTVNAAKRKTEKLEIIPINVYNAMVEFNPVPLKKMQKERFFEKLSGLSRVLNREDIIDTNGIININQ